MFNPFNSKTMLYLAQEEKPNDGGQKAVKAAEAALAAASYALEAAIAVATQNRALI